MYVYVCVRFLLVFKCLPGELWQGLGGATGVSCRQRVLPADRPALAWGCERLCSRPGCRVAPDAHALTHEQSPGAPAPADRPGRAR